jgi:hypothetical protein
MTINVHQDHDRYVERDDHVEVARVHYPAQHGNDAFDRIEYASTERQCLHKMRGWTEHRKDRDERTGRVYESTVEAHGFCLLDAGHKGRHSTVVFGCDGCGRTLRGRAHRTHVDEGVSFCFLCSTGVRY